MNKNIWGQRNPNFRHGMKGSRPYRAWQNMKKRCDNKNSTYYSYYGGRGVSYDPRWNSFIEFWKDMEKTYAINLTLDRKDNNGNYCKENCRWVTQAENNNNKRSSLKLTKDGKTLTVTQWGKLLRISEATIRYRLRYYGWTDVDQILSNKKNNRYATKS